ncbi:MAG: hypothetical protein JWR20_1807, partial [Marmoricola sp.]|nr:hypothetical protein [Marmoricola sp.]
RERLVRRQAEKEAAEQGDSRAREDAVGRQAGPLPAR